MDKSETANRSQFFMKFIEQKKLKYSEATSNIHLNSDEDLQVETVSPRENHKVYFYLIIGRGCFDSLQPLHHCQSNKQ
jgi:hypothetical protein